MNGYVETSVLSSGHFSLESPELVDLETPDYDQLRHDRFDRNRETMQAFAKSVAADVLPKKNLQTVEDLAAIKIQATFRGFLGRKKYIEALYEQFEKEERLRREKTMMQVEEGESLIEIHNLEVELEDNDTTRKNRSRHLNSQITLIQRVWRAHKKRQDGEIHSTPAAAHRLNENEIEQNLASRVQHTMSQGQLHLKPIPITPRGTPEEDRVNINRESSPAVNDLLVNKDQCRQSRESSPGFSLKNTKHLRPEDSECESTVSDYSEIAEAIKDHLTDSDIQIVKKEDLVSGSLPMRSPRPIERLPGEDDVDYSKRVRKTNLLSLAQEFDALKRINPDALPFDLHKSSNRQDFSPVSENTSSLSESASALSINTPTDNKVFVFQPPPGVSESEGRTAESRDADNTMHVKINDNPDSRHDPSNHDQNTATSDYIDIPDNTRSHVEVKPSHTYTGGQSSQLTQTIDPLTNNTTPADSCLSALNNINRTHVNVKSGTGTPNSKNYVEKRQLKMQVETSLPKLDVWSKLDEKIHRAEQEKQKQQSRRNEREEIRRKLAAESWDDDFYGGGSERYKKPNLQSRLQGGMNLQICFVNESYIDPDSTSLNEAGSGQGQNSTADKSESNQDTITQSSSESLPPPKPPRTYVETSDHNDNQTDKSDSDVNVSNETATQDSTTEENAKQDEDFFTKQARLQTEARLALAQAKPMAQMQLEIERLERQSKRKSHVAEMIGIPGFTGGKWKQLSRSTLIEMNLAQLQVLVNDLHTHIEAFNEELVQALIQRDELHMSQDSMLVDIEDLTKRAQECARRINMKTAKKSSKKT